MERASQTGENKSKRFKARMQSEGEPLLLSQQDGWTTNYNRSAMCRGIPHPRGRLAPDQHGRRADDDRIRRSNTDALVANGRGRHSPDQYRWHTWTNNWTTDMRDRWSTGSDHRADMHICKASCKRHDGLQQGKGAGCARQINFSEFWAVQKKEVIFRNQLSQPTTSFGQL